MKKYTVTQIADMLETNPETVRRWIRDDKLKAEQTSRKSGNQVSAAALAGFLKRTPKYAHRAAEKGLNLDVPVQVRIIEKIPDSRENARTMVYGGNPGIGKNRDAFAKVLGCPKQTVKAVVPAEEKYMGLQVLELTSRLEMQEKEIAALKRQIRGMRVKSGAVGSRKK